MVAAHARPMNSSAPLSTDGARSATDLSRPDARVGAPASPERRIVLEAGRADLNYWHDLWHYRELFAMLAWRDISVRYKQTVIGVAWAIVRPLLTMVVFTIIFGTLAKLPSD